MPSRYLWLRVSPKSSRSSSGDTSAARARHNAAVDPPDGFADITDVTNMTGLFSQSYSRSGRARDSLE